MSIKRKLTLMTMGISITAIMLTVAAITTYLIYDMRKSTVQALALNAAIAGDRNSAGLMFQDKDMVQKNLEIYALSPAIQAACIYTTQKNIFAKYEALAPTIPVSCPSIWSEHSEYSSDILTVFEAIRKNDEVVGYVFLVSDTQEIQKYINKIVQISCAVAFFVSIIALLVTLYFRRTISEPLLELTRVANAITTQHDYSIEANEHYPDETGVLAQAFNEMLGVVRKRDEELKLANEQLEAKVASRTRQIAEALVRAEEANEAKNEFLRNMSHEFRTPLHAIVIFSSYGISEFDTATREDLQTYFERIRKASDRMDKLINEVLDLARLERGTQVFNKEPAELRDLANQVAEIVSPLILEKGVSLKFDYAEAEVNTICDHNKVMQVITNLLSNALKFTPSGKSITVKISRNSPESEVMLSIIDEGIGIPEDEKEKIFESFQQSSRTNTGAGGTGLGLAICHNIISAHEGRIWAENNANGLGACVSFTLPEADKDVLFPLVQSVEITYENSFKA